MKCGLVLAVWLATIASGSTQSQEAIVGFYRLRLEPGLHLISPPLAPLALASGRVASVTPHQLTAANAQWTDGQWAGHQIIFTSGAAVGWRYLVTSNTTNALQLIPDPLSEGVVGVGDSYEVLPNLEEYFGEQLRGGAQADRVGFYDWQNPTTEPVMLWKDASGLRRVPGGGFASVGVIAGQGFWLDVSDSDGLGQPRELMLTGRLSAWPGGGVPVEAGAQILSIPLPSKWDMSQINWTALGAISAATPEQADQLGVYDPSTGHLQWAWSSPAGWQWLAPATNAASNAPPSAVNVSLPPGQGCVYVHRGHGFFLNWSTLP